MELRPESFNPAHQVTRLDLALHILQIEGIAVGGLIGKLRGKADGEPDQDQEAARVTKQPAGRDGAAKRVSQARPREPERSRHVIG